MIAWINRSLYKASYPLLVLFLLPLSVMGHIAKDRFEALKPYIEQQIIQLSSTSIPELSAQELKKQPNKALIENPLSAAEQLLLYVQLFEDKLEHTIDPDATRIDTSFITKMEIFNTGVSNLFNNINKTHSRVGSLLLADKLAHPTKNYDHLIKVQNALKALIAYPALHNEINNQLSFFAGHEAQLLTFYKPNASHTDKLLEQVYYGKYLNGFNKSPAALIISSLKRNFNTVTQFFKVPYVVTTLTASLTLAAQAIKKKIIAVELKNIKKYEALIRQKQHNAPLETMNDYDKRLLRSTLNDAQWEIDFSQNNIRKILTINELPKPWNFKAHTYFSAGDIKHNTLLAVKKGFSVLYNPFKTVPPANVPQTLGDLINDIRNDRTIQDNKFIKPAAIAGLVGFGLAIAFYQIYSSKNAVDKALLEKDILEYIYGKTHAVACYMHTIKQLAHLIQRTPSLYALEELHPIIALSTTSEPKMVNLMNLLESAQQEKPSAVLLLAPAKILAAFKIINELKDEFAPSLQALGILDAYCSSAKLVESTAHSNVSYCFAVYLTNNEKPYVRAQNFWNPFIAPTHAIPNSLEFGTVTNPNNAILTGPNTAGKTTTLKGMVTTILMAQTLGIAPAESLTLTPFSILNCYVNITDSLSEGVSLFKAEVLRAKDLLQGIASLSPQEFCFTLMDEIFSGTSPKEGKYAAYLFAEKLSKFSNSLTILATHYSKLTTLPDTNSTQSGFKNYTIPAWVNPDGSWHRPFTIQEGYSHYNVALDILKQEGVL